MANDVNIKKEEEYHVTLEFIAGSKQGFDAIFEVFYIHLYYFAVSIIKDHDDAKDMVLSALEACFSIHNRFTKFDSIKGYLFITVRNKCLKYLDYNKKFDRDLSIYDQVVPIEEYIDAKIVRSEFLMMVYRAIEKLPTQIKQVFKLSYIEGKETPEIAKILNTNAQTVSTARYKGIRLLRGYLNVTPKHTR